MTKPMAVELPAELTSHCDSIMSDGTIGQELTRLADLAQCEFDKQDAAKVWSDQQAASPTP